MKTEYRNEIYIYIYEQKNQTINANAEQTPLQPVRCSIMRILSSDQMSHCFVAAGAISNMRGLRAVFSCRLGVVSLEGRNSSVGKASD